MKRIPCLPRIGWPEKVEQVGLTYHTADGIPYWDESAYYEFSAREVDVLEKAANDLHAMCIEAADSVIQRNLFAQLGIPEAAVPWILKSWERDDFSLYGRFDLAFDGLNPPKMLEYNADTPTSLVEAAVAQWYWLEETHPHTDQFNSIHEHLIAAWKQLRPQVLGKVHLGGVKGSLEDEQTVLYIQDTCHQAGLESEQTFIEDLGFDTNRRRFLDLADNEVRTYFKLYPWEWMWREPFAEHLKLELIQFIEPMWKMLLSNKGLLAVLWELYPGHPNLLPAFWTQEDCLKACGDRGYVRKPMLSREGANIQIVRGGEVVIETEGDYGGELQVYQALAAIPTFDGKHPVMGAWVVNHEACGLGIREDDTLVTGNLSRFVPHIFF